MSLRWDDRQLFATTVLKKTWCYGATKIWYTNLTVSGSICCLIKALIQVVGVLGVQCHAGAVHPDAARCPKHGTFQVPSSPERRRFALLFEGEFGCRCPLNKDGQMFGEE